MNILKKKKNKSCHEQSNNSKPCSKKIALVGTPNVGKSVLFNTLTGIYVTVSNYPGTTVEVSRGNVKIDNTEYEVIDTPGMYSLLSLTEEEKVARDILLHESPDTILHVIDAKNIERMLPFTLQLIEANLPVILVLNMMDEAEKLNKAIDIDILKNELQIPVVPTVGIEKKGIDTLRNEIKKYKPVTGKQLITYDNTIGLSIEKAIIKIENILTGRYLLSTRAISLLLMQEAGGFEDILNDDDKDNIEKIQDLINETGIHYKNPLDYIITITRQNKVKEITHLCVKPDHKKGFQLRNFISNLTMNPITGIPILLLVVYFGLFKFVGEFGSGTLVDFLESVVFEGYINPFLTKVFTAIIPWEIVQDLFIGEYGVLTLGLRYALAIILPIVTIFFFMFAIIEDSGYLPRLAMLVDRIFKKIGLSGRAVIPMVLGLGCDTMATLVTRTLPTKRERMISTILLALAVPCSAQLGVILALLGTNKIALLIWVGVIGAIFLLVGFLTAKLYPGQKPVFYMELPPLRIPKISNILSKTYTRVEWYLKEIIPIFLLGSVLIWLGQVTRLFDLLLWLIKFPVKLIGLPVETAPVFLLGFFRRDYGAAGLYDLNKQGLLTGVQLVVACVALTLFLPCVAQLLINIKERGIKAGIGISIFVLFFSFTAAFVLNYVLSSLGVVL